MSNTLPWYIASRENLVREWTASFDSGGEDRALRDVLLASETGGELPKGLYYLVSRFPANESGNLSQTALVVADANLTVMRAHDETLVWLTDMVSAAPVEGATVTIYHRDEAIARGASDADGIFRAPVQLPRDDAFITIIAESDDHYGVWISGYQPQPPTTEAYLYTDRPIYRPGDTVYFRGVARDKDDMDFSVPNVRTLRVTAGSFWSDETFFTGDVELTTFGTFSGEFVLPEEATVGDGFLRIESEADDTGYPAGIEFTVAEYRVPEFEVAVTAQQDDLFQGDTLSAIAEASYYFGGAVSDAALNWAAYGEPTAFNYTGPGAYHFGDDTWRYTWVDVGRGDGATDTDGRFLISTDNTTPDTSNPLRVTVEATVTDESQQAISGRTTLTLHPADVYIGIRASRFFGQAGEPLNVALIAVDAASAPLPGQRIDLTIEEIRWTRVPIEGEFGRYNWEEEVIEVETAQITAGDDGTASYAFTPERGGVFRVRATAMDDKERTSSSAQRFWVFGGGPVWWGAPFSEEYITLNADKDSYVPGETAQVLVQLPFQGRSTVLMTTERVNVMTTEVIEVEGSTLVYEVPITTDSAPTLHVSAVVIKGIDDESVAPGYRQGRVYLNIEPVNRRLTVTVTPSVTRAQPREEVTFDVTVTDAAGAPAVAEVGLALVDKAILALREPNSVTLEEGFYHYQGNYVDTVVSVYGLLDRFTMMAADGRGGGGGGGGGPEMPLVREDFEQTPLWVPHVVTGEDGRASVSVTLPDNLTTWHLDARGVTLDTDVGQTTTEVVATLPLLVRPVAPRFFVVGDRVQLAAVINNNSDSDQTVEARLDAAGVVLEGAAAQTVTVEAGQRARVEWDAVVQDVDYVDLTFYAVGGEYQDAAKPMLATGPDGTIPVYRYTAPDTVGTGGVLREEGARTEAVSLPPRLDADQGALTVRLDPSLAVTATDAFDYLLNYPHQCIEQTVSRFLPNAVTYRALRTLDITDPALEAGLASALGDGLAKLTQAQNADGGWGWFSGMASDPLVTAYAALGLIEARDAGFAIDAAMLDRAVNFVQTQRVTPRVETPDWQLNRQAFFLYVLAREGIGTANDYATLMEQRLRISYAGRAYLLMAFDALFPGNMAIDLLASDLTTAARLSATGAHWEEEYTDWWNWGSDTRTTALVLSALTRATPESDLLPNAVRWLMVARQGDHWTTTQETAWAVIAFTDWMALTGELQGNYDYSASLNREALAEGSVTPATVREGQVLHVAVSDLLRDEANRLVVARGAGEGNLYYTAHLELRLPASEVSALSRGISVQREYFLAGEEGEDATPVTGAQLGDTITVRLTLTLPEDVFYFVLEDPIPAGVEAVDTGLLTTSSLAEEPSIQREIEEDPYWYWGWWWFDRTEMRDEQVNLYADFLPRGTYVYTYQVRASVAGAFQTLPAHAYAFYFPEVFGRSDGALFTVEPAPVE
ncbi:MAG: MG2 domain-containing protein [Anaerolineae bacterium]|nr:MG2 domain-containing protein [Anaerolineae bacterium]